MLASDLPTFLIAFASGLAAMWTLVMTRRSVSRSQPRLSVTRTDLTAEGLTVILKNEGLAPAEAIEFVVSGAHDGAIMHLHDSLAPGSSVELARACPTGDRFDVSMTYRHRGGVSFLARRTLRRTGSGPLRITFLEDRIVRRRLRDWASDMFRR